MADYITMAALTIVMAGCGARTSPPGPPPDPVGPTILSITPTSGPAGMAYPIEITIAGRGFAEEGNIVNFGSLVVGQLPATEGGTRISFQAPKQHPATGGAAPMELLPGLYPITVTTNGVTSPAVNFELVRGEF